MLTLGKLLSGVNNHINSLKHWPIESPTKLFVLNVVHVMVTFVILL